MVTTTDAPNPPSVPVINLSANFSLPGFAAESISDVIWNSISVATPSVPTFVFPDRPTNVDPTEPIQPTLKTLDIPEQEAFTVLQDPPKAPKVVDINVPDRITLESWTEQPPQFNIQAPVENVDWSYATFTTEFRDVLTNLFGSFTRSESAKGFFELLNKSIFENPIDCLEERGNENPVTSKTTRMLKLSEGDFKSFQEVLDHELEWKYKSSEVENRQENERILRDQYKNQKALEFQFANKVASVWVQNYNACIQIYNAQTANYAALAEDYRAKIQANGLRIEKMGKELSISNDIKNYNSELVAIFQAEAESNASLIELFKSQMNVARRLLALELLSLELFQVEIEAFTASVRVLEGQAREIEAFAIADATVAETTIAPSLLAELNAKIDVAEAELDVEKARFEAARKVYFAKERAVNAEIRTFSDGLSSQSDLIQSQVELARERSVLERNNREYSARTEEDRRLVNFQDRLSQNQINKDREGTGGGFTGFLGELESRRDDELFTDREFNVKVNEAELDAVEKFAAAEIINTLTHTIQSG